MAEKARFISRYGNYSVGVQSLIQESFGTGEKKTLKPRIDAQFQRSLVTDDDLAVAVQSFSFPGLPFDEETNSHVSPRFRISVWDSEWAQLNEGWDDDQIDQIISKLRSTSGLNHFELELQKLGEPFPNYDTLSVDDILKVADVANIDPTKIVAYERENENRGELIDALLGVTAGDDSVVVQA